MSNIDTMTRDQAKANGMEELWILTAEESAKQDLEDHMCTILISQQNICEKINTLFERFDGSPLSIDIAESAMECFQKVWRVADNLIDCLEQNGMPEENINNLGITLFNDLLAIKMQTLNQLIFKAKFGSDGNCDPCLIISTPPLPNPPLPTSVSLLLQKVA